MPYGRDGRVGVEDLDVVGADAELVGHDHRPRRLVALAVGGGAGDHLDLAGRQDPDGGRLPAAGGVVERGQRPARRQAAHLHVRGEADAEVLGARPRPGAGAARPAARRSRPARAPWPAPARSRRCRRPGRRPSCTGTARADEVAPPDLGRVDADLPGQGVDGPLDGVGRLGPAGAAVGVGRRLGREHRRAGERVGAARRRRPGRGTRRAAGCRVSPAAGRRPCRPAAGPAPR